MLVPPNAAHCGSAGDGSLPRVRDIADESRFLARAKRQTRKSDSLPEHCAATRSFPIVLAEQIMAGRSTRAAALLFRAYFRSRSRTFALSNVASCSAVSRRRKMVACR